MHPDEIFRLEKKTASAIRAAVGSLSSQRLRVLFDEHAGQSAAVLAIGAWVRVDDRLIVQHADAEREKARDRFILDLKSWADDAGATELSGRLGDLQELIATIEHGYRLISRSLDDLPFSRLPREKQFAAVLHRAAADFEDVIARGPRFAGEGELNLSAEVVVAGDDGQPIGVDSMTASVADLVSNLIEFLAYGEWPSGREGFEFPDSPPPSPEEVECAGKALTFSLAWTRWTRWEREARYWDGNLRVVPEAELSNELRSVPDLIVHQHDRGRETKRDWIAVERLKLQQKQNLVRFEFYDRRDYAGSTSTRLPPEEFIDVAERLSDTLIFAGAHLDHQDTSTYGGATLREWLRGYATLRRIGQEPLEASSGAGRHLIRFTRADLVDKLVSAGLTRTGAEAFVKGATYRKKSVDLFDSPLLWLGEDRFLAFGPCLANLDTGRALLSNLPSLGFKLDHKGQAFEFAVESFLGAIGAQPIRPARRKFGSEEYQIDVILPWDNYLFLFECKNLAPSNLHPKTGFEFRGEHLENVRQTARLAEGLRKHPEILTAANGPDPRGMTIVPVVLYAMPYALPGRDRGVYTADFSMLTRFFRSKDIGQETQIRVDEGRYRTHRQVTERLWKGERPTPEDLLRALADPWGVRFVDRRAEIDWSYISLAPYQLARSPYHRYVELSRVETAKLHGIDIRKWDRDIQRVQKEAEAERHRRQKHELIIQMRRFRSRSKMGGGL